MSKTNIKATIDANVKRNGNQAITGQILNSVLNGMVDSLADQAETTDKFNNQGAKLSELEEQINGIVDKRTIDGQHYVLISSDTIPVNPNADYRFLIEKSWTIPEGLSATNVMIEVFQYDEDLNNIGTIIQLRVETFSGLSLDNAFTTLSNARYVRYGVRIERGDSVEFTLIDESNLTSKVARSLEKIDAIEPKVAGLEQAVGVEYDVNEGDYEKVFAFINGSGVWATQDGCYSIFVPVYKGAKIDITADNTTCVYALLTAKTYNVGSSVSTFANGFGSRYTITANNSASVQLPKDTDAAFLCVRADSLAKFPSSLKITIVSDFVKREEILTEKIGKNLVDTSKMSAGYLTSTGGLTSGAYSTTDFIPVPVGQSVVINKQIRKFLGFNQDKTPISETFRTNTTAAGYVFTNNYAFDVYIRASFFNSDSDYQIEYGSVVTPYEEYHKEKVFADGISLSETMVGEVGNHNGNAFEGKKWVACGDSFTEGDFANSLTNDYRFTDMPYKGYKKVYPYWIGRRNLGMVIVNEAKSGSTMTAGSTGVNPFSGTRYLQIPSDADYITLRFGINDAGHGCPLGTINDTTNETFYGAWNVVLDYLTTNFPFAHIGIIVGEGMQTANGQQYALAEIEVAKKWGIPYLNIQFESGNGVIPLTFRTSNPNISSAILNKKFQAFVVNPNSGTANHHPNEKAHEYESAFIEAWMRTL